MTIAAVLLLLCGGGYGLYSLKGCKGPEIITPKRMTDQEIYAKYKNSTVLLIGYYYYKVSAGNLDLNKMELPTEVVISDGKLKATNGLQNKMNTLTGTGFYISKDGKIVTNLHMVRPWLFDKELSLISDQYKMFMASAASENPALNAFTAQVKVEGVLAYIGMIPNGAYFSNENLKQCRELVVHEDKNKDVAIIQLETKIFLIQIAISLI